MHFSDFNNYCKEVFDKILFIYFNTLFDMYEGNQVHQHGKKPNFCELYIFWQDHLPGMQLHIHYNAENYRYVWRHLEINGYIYRISRKGTKGVGVCTSS